MSRTQGYLRHLSILLLISLYSIQQVSSRKCYQCDSRDHPDCFSTGNNLTRFIFECATFGSRSSFSATPLQKQGNQEATAVEYECGFAKGISTASGRPVVTRGCVLKPVTCDTNKIYYAAHEAFQVDSCKRCDTDLCNSQNSSGHLSTGIWTVSISLLALYFVKF